MNTLFDCAIGSSIGMMYDMMSIGSSLFSIVYKSYPSRYTQPLNLATSVDIANIDKYLRLWLRYSIHNSILYQSPSGYQQILVKAYQNVLNDIHQFNDRHMYTLSTSGYESSNKIKRTLTNTTYLSLHYKMYVYNCWKMYPDATNRIVESYMEEYIKIFHSITRINSLSIKELVQTLFMYNFSNKHTWIRETVDMSSIQIPPFNYDMILYSPLWSGPALSQYSGIRGTFKPGISSYEEFNRRLYHLIGENGMQFIQNYPGILALTGSIMCAANMAKWPSRYDTWEQYVADQYAISDIDLIYKSLLFSQFARFVEQLLVNYADQIENIERIGYHMIKIPVVCKRSTTQIVDKFKQDYPDVKNYHVVYISHYDFTREEGVQHILGANNNFQYKVQEHFRIKVKLSNISRPLEIFWANSIKKKVAGFHFPCVRSFFLSGTRYFETSCIYTMLTGCNMEISFEGTKNPKEVVQKYIDRGFGILLNADELEELELVNDPVGTGVCEDISGTYNMYYDLINIDF